MNSNSFLIKGWALTIFSVIMAFASKDTNSTMILVNFVPIFVFWGLDAFYLRKERLFRELYKATIKKNSEVPVFSMNTECYEKNMESWFKVCRSITIWPLYGALLVSNIVALTILFNSGILSFVCKTICK